MAFLRAPVSHKTNPSGNWELKLMEKQFPVGTGTRIRISASPCVSQSKSQWQLGFEVDGKATPSWHWDMNSNFCEPLRLTNQLGLEVKQLPVGTGTRIRISARPCVSQSKSRWQLEVDGKATPNWHWDSNSHFCEPLCLTKQIPVATGI